MILWGFGNNIYVHIQFIVGRDIRKAKAWSLAVCMNKIHNFLRDKVSDQLLWVYATVNLIRKM
jgi:hypothetical protein